ncbi:MAG: hypothetical protein IKJ87_02480 [Ruminococcus sp.]|nr:hypothetical protein [Ruminococcus sp.]
MYKDKIIALGCGVIALMLVLMTGKSCTNTDKKPAKSTSATAAPTESFEVITPDLGFIENEIYNEPKVQYDEFGRPIRATEPPPTEVPAEVFGGEISGENGENIEVPTDEDGNIIETTENIETTEETEASDENVPTEAITQKFTVPPGFGGNDHKKYDDDGNEQATVPPDFYIEIG